MTLVVDASLVTALLQSADTELLDWLADEVETHAFAAPHLMPVEVTNALRRAELTALLSPSVAALAYADLIELDVQLVPFEPFAERVWELRHAVTPYDAWYVALAEAIDAPLATLDRTLARTTGSRCEFLVPP